MAPRLIAAVYNRLCRPRQTYARIAVAILALITFHAATENAVSKEGIQLAQVSTPMSPSTVSTSPSIGPSTAIMGCGPQVTTCTFSSCAAACNTSVSTCQLNCMVPRMPTAGAAANTTINPPAPLTTTSPSAQAVSVSGQNQSGTTNAIPVGQPAASPACIINCMSIQLACQQSCSGLPTTAPSQSASPSTGAVPAAGPSGSPSPGN